MHHPLPGWTVQPAGVTDAEPCAGEVLGGLVHVERTGQEEALPERTAEFHQSVELVRSFDPLGDDLELHGARQPDDGADQGRAGRFGPVERLDEGPVDLEHVHREPLEVAQRRVAGAEVVDGDGDAHLPQLGQGNGGPLGVVHEDVLGDLEGELDGVEPDCPEDLTHVIGQVRATSAGGVRG